MFPSLLQAVSDLLLFLSLGLIFLLLHLAFYFWCCNIWQSFGHPKLLGAHFFFYFLPFGLVLWFARLFWLLPLFFAFLFCLNHDMFTCSMIYLLWLWLLYLFLLWLFGLLFVSVVVCGNSHYILNEIFNICNILLTLSCFGVFGLQVGCFLYLLLARRTFLLATYLCFVYPALPHLLLIFLVETHLFNLRCFFAFDIFLLVLF